MASSEEFKAVLAEISPLGRADYYLSADEPHTVSAGGSEGAMDAGNMLGPCSPARRAAHGRAPRRHPREHRKTRRAERRSQVFAGEPAMIMPFAQLKHEHHQGDHSPGGGRFVASR